MADENEDKQTQQQDKTPTSVDGILKQIAGEVAKGQANKFKEQAKTILAKKEEHQRSIKTLDAELEQLKDKFLAGLL